MAKSVKTIPATLNRFTAAPVATKVKRRVAAYARVSTDHEEQQTSYAAQVSYYTEYIQNNPDWEFIKVYADEGLTGCNTKKREAFNAMIADALAGRIDLIITKSVSRFARNTVDSLTAIRKLKENGVECYFEKESIWTFDGRGELLISIMSSLAQEESRSISENVTWGQRKRFADGKVTVPFGRFLGYDRGEHGELIVNQQEAEIVRRIYSLFLQGQTPYGIAKILTQDGIPTPGGKTNWGGTTVRSILTNEKYKGDALLQKSFCTDFLTKKYKPNNGEIPQYYVEDDHEAIIEPEIFDLVQREIASRNRGKNRHSGVHIFSGKIRCSQCGGWYGSKVWHSNDRFRRVVWRCNHKYEGVKCTTPHLTEEQIQAGFVAAVEKLMAGRQQVIADFIAARDTVFDITGLTAQKAELESEMQIVSELMEQALRDNAANAQDQDDFNRRFNALDQRYREVETRLNAVSDQIKDKLLRKAQIDDFFRSLEGIQSIEFSPALWSSLIDHVTVYGKNDIRYTFKNGTEI